MKPIIFIIILLITLNVSSYSSCLLRPFKKIDLISSGRLMSTYLIHDHIIYDPLTHAQKSKMTRFAPRAFLPKYNAKKVFYPMWSDEYNSQSLDRPIAKYFEKSPRGIIGEYTCVKSCPPLLTSLELPVSVDFFIKKEKHRDLTLKELSNCVHYLSNLHNIYFYAFEKDYPIIHAIDKSVNVGGFVAISLYALEALEQKNEKELNNLLDELRSDMASLLSVHFYTHPSDPYSFYVNQSASLTLYELTKYRK